MLNKVITTAPVVLFVCLVGCAPAPVQDVEVDDAAIGAMYDRRKDGGEPVPFDQKYVDHLRKRPDGSWEIVLHMWSPNDTGPNIWH